MESSAYVVNLAALTGEGPAARPSVAPVPPPGGWALVPAGDELVALAASLNVPGEPPVFLDRVA